MLGKIEALRRKPPHVRNRYAFWIASSLTLIIVVVWSSTLPSRFQDEEIIEEPLPSNNTGGYVETVRSFFSGIGDRMGGQEVPTEQNVGPERVNLVELVASTTLQERLQPTSVSGTGSSTQTTSTSTVITATTSASSTPQVN